MQAERSSIIGLGEVLWDIFQDGKALGGAPCNSAYHANSLGYEGLVFSRVGEDALGDEIIAELKRLGMKSDYIQRDPHHSTGTVNVRLDADGIPDFTIVEDVAYDFMEVDDSWLQAARRSSAICFGTLAQRSNKSRGTIERVLDEARGALGVYDVNLRQNFYSRQILAESLSHANLLKLNEQEVLQIEDILGGTDGVDAFLRGIMKEYDIALSCVTKGEDGCTLYSEEERVSRPVPLTDVCDTVGSGDAFTAGLVVKFLEGRPLDCIAEGANLLGAYVAGCRGGTPAVTREIIDRFNEL